ncbi:MAG: T9SS type A sorting domain-containing protein [Bacteroidetes bacterium]|nr:T9SS type A sorting domain-containing protein [Bacteroidota bacterium]
MLFRNLFLTFVLVFIVSTVAKAQVYNWAYSAGGSGWDDVKSTYLGDDQATLVTGMFSNTAQFGATSLTSTAYQDAFVAKYDQQGTLLWAKAISGDEQDWGYKVTSDHNNNVYVTGYFQSSSLHFTPNDSLIKNAQSSRNVFLAKYNSSGVFQWARLGSGGNTNAYLTSRSVTTDDQNNIIISGDYNKQIEFNGNQLPATGGSNIFMVKYDPNGNVIWTKAGVSNSICWFTDLTTDGANNIYGTGKISTPITFGATTIPNHSGDDLVIAKFDASGTLAWMQVVGNYIMSTTTSNNFDCGSGIKVDNGGNVFVGGSLLDTTYYDANLNMLIVKQFACITKYNSSGVQQWLKKFGNDEKDIITAIDLDANGDVYAIGNYRNAFTVGGITLPASNVTAAFVAKFSSSNGNTVFAHKNGSSVDEMEGYGIGIHPTSGNVYTAGNYKSTTTFSNNTLNCQGVWDIYLTLLANNVVQGLSVVDDNDLMSIYPNPASDRLNLSMTNPLDRLNAQVSIYSVVGQLMSRQKLNDQDIVDISTLASGNYILELSNGQKTQRKPFTKE